MESAAFFFPVVFITSIWVTVIIGNIDDDPHREMVAASAGGQRRLHTLRARASAMLLIMVHAPLALVVVLGGPNIALQATMAVPLLFLGAIALGVGVGNLLHRPLVDEVGVAALAGPLALAGLMLFPPVQWVLRQTNDGSSIGAVALFPVSVAAGSLFLIMARWMLRRRRIG